MTNHLLSDKHCSFASKAARSAGDILKKSFESKTTALSSSSRDIKTQADLDANHAIVSILRETDIPILSEEFTAIDANPSVDTCWIVDPLDGTVNFFRGSPLCCTSIGLWSKGRPIFGVVYNFLTSELYTGGPRFPTTCNGLSIAVSEITKSEEAIMATGFPNGREFDSPSLRNFVSQIQSFRKVRLLGSAALSLAWLAQGKLDAYYEEDIYLWDIAAGLPIVLGAGGEVAFSGIDLESMRLTVTATSTLEILKTIKC